MAKTSSKGDDGNTKKLTKETDNTKETESDDKWPFYKNTYILDLCRSASYWNGRLLARLYVSVDFLNSLGVRIATINIILSIRESWRWWAKQNAYKLRKLVLVSYRYNNRYPGCTTRMSVPSQPTYLNKLVSKKNKNKKSN